MYKTQVHGVQWIILIRDKSQHISQPATSGSEYTNIIYKSKIKEKLIDFGTINKLLILILLMNAVALFCGSKSRIFNFHNYDMTFPTGLTTTIGKFVGPVSRPVLFSGMSFFKLLFKCADIVDQ